MRTPGRFFIEMKTVATTITDCTEVDTETTGTGPLNILLGNCTLHYVYSMSSSPVCLHT